MTVQPKYFIMPPSTTSEIQIQLVTRKTVNIITASSRSTSYGRNDPKSKQYDPSFPKPVTLPNSNAKRFVLHEVEAWVRAQITRRDSLAGPKESEQPESLPEPIQYHGKNQSDRGHS